jgi:hypothetical protein
MEHSSIGSAAAAATDADVEHPEPPAAAAAAEVEAKTPGAAQNKWWDRLDGWNQPGESASEHLNEILEKERRQKASEDDFDATDGPRRMPSPRQTKRPKCNMKVTVTNTAEIEGEEVVTYYLAREGGHRCDLNTQEAKDNEKSCVPRFETFLCGLHCAANGKEVVIKVPKQRLSIAIRDTSIQFRMDSGAFMQFEMNEGLWMIRYVEERAVMGAFHSVWGSRWFKQSNLKMGGDKLISWSPSRGVVGRENYEKWGPPKRYYGALALAAAAAYGAHRAGAFTKVQRYFAKKAA